MNNNFFGGFNLQDMDEETAMRLAMVMSMQQQQPTFFRPMDPREVGAVGMESVLKCEYIHPQNHRKLQIRKGDMTKEKVDVIVNAANGVLEHASGLAGAIVREGGKIIQQESNEQYYKNGSKGFPDGAVIVTSAGKMQCKHVFHAVGPVWPSMRKGNPQLGSVEEDVALEQCVSNSIKEAENRGLTSISFPAISSGIFGYPKDRCAEVLFNTIDKYFLNAQDTCITEVRFTNFDDLTVDIFVEEFNKRFAKKQ